MNADHFNKNKIEIGIVNTYDGLLKWKQTTPKAFPSGVVVGTTPDCFGFLQSCNYYNNTGWCPAASLTKQHSESEVYKEAVQVQGIHTLNSLLGHRCIVFHIVS